MCNSKVTIIIPVYNGADTISRTIDSLIAQTYDDWIALVINDGSTDGTNDILMQYKNRYPSKIKVVCQKNIGQAETRNHAVKMAAGKYVMFVDADDYLDPDYVGTYVKEAEKGDYDCVIGGFRREDNKGNIIKKFVPSSRWLMYSHMVPWARIFKRQFLLDNDIEFLNISIGEDSYFNFMVLCATDNIKCIDNMGYVWYVNNGSISFRKHTGFSVTNEILCLLNNLAEIIDVSDELNQAWLVRYVVWYILFSGRNATSEEFLETDAVLFEWLSAHKVKIEFPVRGITDGETLKIKFCVKMYLIMRRYNLLKIFAKIYCRSK